MAPKTIHQQISAFLTVVLTMFVGEREMGEILPGPEMRLRNDRSYREPHLLFIASEHVGRLDADGLKGPADLVVEIVSNDSVRRDREEKHAEYEAAGVPEYRVIDPRPLRHTFDAYTLSEAGAYEKIAPDALERIRSVAIPGLRVDPAWLWSDPLQSAPAALKLIAAGQPERRGATSRATNLLPRLPCRTYVLM